jgi:predicted metalloprotease
MRWRNLRRSSNVDDIRGRGRGYSRPGAPMRFGMRGGGITLIIVLIIGYFFAGPQIFSLLLGDGSVAPPPPGMATNSTAPDDEVGEFVSTILASTEDEWGAIFADSGQRYVPPRLTLFSDAVQSACGYTSAATGPFYCPADRRVYLDTSFFADLARLGGTGDFAAAYVIGHEIGHHVQTLLGTAGDVRQAQSAVGEAERNRLQVAMELQADCYAGVWANRANRRTPLLEPGDVEEGLRAAAAIGDDRMQRNAGRRVTPESFTHGASEQRRSWLMIGLSSGNPNDCNTFSR